MRAGRPARARHTKRRKKIMDSKKINAEIQKHYKAIKAAAKAARADKGSEAAKVERKAAAKAARADKGSAKKSAAAKKAARKPVKSAAKVDEGIYIAPVEDAPEAPQKAAEAKPRKAAKVERKAATKAARADKGSADFEPVKLPAVFHSPDGGGELTITATSITYSQGLREVIFPARSAHYFVRDYKVGERVIAAGSVGVKVGGKSLVIGPEAPAIVAAVRTAKAAADKAAKAAKAKGGVK